MVHDYHRRSPRTFSRISPGRRRCSTHRPRNSRHTIDEPAAQGLKDQFKTGPPTVSTGFHPASLLNLTLLTPLTILGNFIDPVGSLLRSLTCVLLKETYGEGRLILVPTTVTSQDVMFPP